jgi:hypothetical protein
VTSGFIPEGREVDLAQWCATLSLDMLADVLQTAQDKAAMEWNRTPWWRAFRRRQAQRKLDTMTALYWEVAMAAQHADRLR